MDNRTLILSADTAIRLDNLARRLGLPVEQALTQISGRMDVMDRIAAMLAVEVVAGPAPLRLRPAEAVSEEIAVIETGVNTVSCRLPHADERFCEVVKGMGYRWGGMWWTRIIGKFAEPVSDRAVELGVRILAAGFPLEVRSAEFQRRIAASEYTPETRTWVSARTAGKYAGWFCIQWDREERDYFERASLIQGTRCYPGAALAPAARYDEVLDFAEVHGFAVSDGALDLAKKAKCERDAMLLVTPVVRPSTGSGCGVEGGVIPPLHPSTEVIGICDELADEPF
jgi:hypothetical protein